MRVVNGRLIIIHHIAQHQKPQDRIEKAEPLDTDRLPGPTGDTGESTQHTAAPRPAADRPEQSAADVQDPARPEAGGHRVALLQHASSHQ